jgi:hypothetical protein
MLPNPTSSDDLPPVDTPDMKARAALEDSGHQTSGIAGYWVKVVVCSIAEWPKILLTMLAGVFDDIAALMTEFFTASQGQDTPGFNKLVAAVLSDTLGVEVSADDLNAAQFEGGRIAAMDKVGADLFNTLGNEFLGIGATNAPGAGIGGLPGTPGVPLTPAQGVKAAQAFMGFALSFAVRQGNVAFLSSALPWEWLSGIREYGEMMAKNLGLGRLTRRALQPFIQTLIATPLQQALNQQYRPHQMSEKQIASAFIRDTTGGFDIKSRLALQGFTDADIQLLVEDTYTRLPLEDVYLLHENGFLTDGELNQRVAALGFSPTDLGLMIQAKNLATVQREDRAYVAGATADFQAGKIDSTTLLADIDNTTLPKVEKEALRRNALNRINKHQKQLSLGFLHKAYLAGTITIDEYLQHALALGYSQDDVDILEVQLLSDQAAHKAAAAAKAAALAKKLAGKGTTTP